MKKTISLLFITLAAALCCNAKALKRSYEELPLGAIRPQGWLEEMLIRQRDGITANLDETYAEVMGPENGWLGGTGDRWERGPYWIDGLLPMAYILDDKNLKDKAQVWVEHFIASAREDGYFGPDKEYPPVPGIQRDKPFDWWPKMVVLKILQQYYNATADERVMGVLGGYFRYQLDSLPAKHLDHWSYWGKYREGDNLDVLLWYYSKTQERWLLDLAKLLHQQGFDFTNAFLEGKMLSEIGSIHGVNLAQGLKEPVIWYQIDPKQKYLDAVHKAMDDLRHYHGWAIGMYGADEALHGSSPTQGSELCTAVELMFSYEQMLKVTGDIRFADELEKVAFNALPAQVSEDFKYHQYFQQANQVRASIGKRNFDCPHSGTDVVFGFKSGYPCCLSNLHQGWPKFTQNLWYKSPEGLAALVYAPCRVNTEIAGKAVCISEETAYPMESTVRFRFSLKEAVSFSLSIRIPAWSGKASLKLNGNALELEENATIQHIEREWHDGDLLELSLPMNINVTRWHENSVSVERGPLVYALGIKEKWQQYKFNERLRKYHGDSCWEVLPDSPWNYGLIGKQLENPDVSLEVIEDSDKASAKWPWNLANAPIRIKVTASRIPAWQEYDGSAGPLPWSPMAKGDVTRISIHKAGEREQLLLVPYGCTRLRISEFPVLTH